jgi:hypothetical protein
MKIDLQDPVSRVITSFIHPQDDPISRGVMNIKCSG